MNKNKNENKEEFKIQVELNCNPKLGIYSFYNTKDGMDYCKDKDCEVKYTHTGASTNHKITFSKNIYNCMI